MEAALTYANDNQDAFVEQLEEFLRIPSISTDSAHSGDVRRCARWLADHLKHIGIERAQVMESGGHPIVFAEHITDEDAPTVLMYGHYDVQPPDPLDLWDSPPFEPIRRDGILYARGACDDKGQLFMHLKAAEAYLQSGEKLPVNLKFIIEGEEESGSTHFAPFLEKHHDMLGADVVAISDTAMCAPGVPSITYGLRGLAYVEVELTGPNRDLHSGVYGGAVENPANALSRLLAGLHDVHNRVTVPGFYADARPLTEEERAAFAELPFDNDEWKASVGVRDVRTEEGYSILEAITARPTIDVNGLWSGYQGEGAKTVLPAKAGAKLSARLVPDQEPEDIVEKLRAYFDEHTPPTMKLEFRYLHGGKGFVADLDHPAMQAAATAMEGVYDRKPYFTREGGSIPIIAKVKEILGIDSVLMGFGLDSDAIHSPNEHFGLDRFEQGIRSLIRFHAAYAGIMP